jgi:hypothetical protein
MNWYEDLDEQNSGVGNKTQVGRKDEKHSEAKLT